MELVNLGKTPISSPNAAGPAGTDIREDEQYEILVAEIEKLNSISPAGAVDWNKVRAVAAGILAEKSKDLTVAGYLSAALLKTEGLKGLATGIRIIRDLLENFWDNMYPAVSRMRARRNAVEWWVEAVEKNLAGLPGETWPAGERDSLLENLNAADTFLSGNMDNAPMLLSLRNTIERLLTAEEAAEQTAGAQPATVADKAPERAVTEAPAGKTSVPGSVPAAAAPAAAPSAPALSGAVPSKAPENMDLEQTMDFGAGILAGAARIIEVRTPNNPLVYKLNRLAAWLPVTELPPAEAGRTVLPAPDDQEVQALKRLYASQSWADLLELAESMIGRYLFWLDLNRFSYEALIKLGHAVSANVVVMETRMYADRLPGIENLSFNDGSLFADDNTRSWLNSAADKGGSSKAGLADEIARARDFFSGEPLNVSLKKISGEMSRLPSGRERLVLKTGLCRVLTELNQPRLARSFAEDILLSMERHRIESWEPELAVEAFAAAACALRKANESDERVNSLLNRIAVLDPLKALDLI